MATKLRPQHRSKHQAAREYLEDVLRTNPSESMKRRIEEMLRELDAQDESGTTS